MKHKFLILWLAGILGTISILPYIFSLQGEVIAKSGLATYQVVLAAVGQTAVLLAITVFFGLRLARSMRMPVLELFGTGTPVAENLKKLAVIAIPTGVAVGVAIKLADLFFSRYIPELVVTAAQIAFWKNLLAAPYGGIVEEILLRLFCVTLFAWLLGKIFRSPEPVKNGAIMWTAILAATVLFGLGHLPVTSTIVKLTPMVVVRAILLNGIAGVVLGWLYWKKGLEYAMAAHFTADVVLIAVLPALMK